MPIYDFVCLDCGATTEVWATTEELDLGLEPVCERCGSPRLVRKVTAPNIGSSLPTRPAGGGGCSPGGGGGCCG